MQSTHNVTSKPRYPVTRICCHTVHFRIPNVWSVILRLLTTSNQEMLCCCHPKRHTPHYKRLLLSETCFVNHTLASTTLLYVLGDWETWQPALFSTEGRTQPRANYGALNARCGRNVWKQPNNLDWRLPLLPAQPEGHYKLVRLYYNT